MSNTEIFPCCIGSTLRFRIKHFLMKMNYCVMHITIQDYDLTNIVIYIRKRNIMWIKMLNTYNFVLKCAWVHCDSAQKLAKYCPFQIIFIHNLHQIHIYRVNKITGCYLTRNGYKITPTYSMHQLKWL